MKHTTMLVTVPLADGLTAAQARAAVRDALAHKDEFYGRRVSTRPAPTPKVQRPTKPRTDVDDTPRLESGRHNCDDAGTGEGQWHGRM